MSSGARSRLPFALLTGIGTGWMVWETGFWLFKARSSATQAASHELGRAIALAVRFAHGHWYGLDGVGDWVLVV